MIRTVLWGLIIITLGLWIWLANLGIISSGFIFRRDWPVIIIAIGLLTLGEGVSWLIRQRRKG